MLMVALLRQGRLANSSLQLHAPYTALRTPLGLVESDTKDNVFTLFFTAFDSSRDPAMIGSYASLYASELVELLID